jgi:hypothetical protein
MRIDLPTCGFKSCRYCFDGNCTKKVEYDRCEYGTPVFSIEESDEWNKAKWDSILNRMIELLDFMDERNPIYDDCHNFEDHYAMRENANEEFFNLFCENFGRFWD